MLKKDATNCDARGIASEVEGGGKSKNTSESNR
jgi:hypothetical protein